MGSLIRTTRLPCGEEVPILGLGTRGMGEKPAHSADEIDGIRIGIDRGMTLVDTAEVYGDGRAEEIVGRAISGRRDQVFIVNKVVPTRVSEEAISKACAGSLKRLGTDRIDLYLLYQPDKGPPLMDTTASLEALKVAGMIRHWGVANLGVAGMVEVAKLWDRPGIQANQARFHLRNRSIERDLMPWCREFGVPIMACSPLAQGFLANERRLDEIALRYDASLAQIALAWVLRHDGVIAIPKSGKIYHVHENRAALDIQLSRDDLSELDRIFPLPGSAHVPETSRPRA